MAQSRFIGLMSGTSMDGVDGVLTDFDTDGRPHLRAFVSTPFDDSLRDALFALQQAGENEIEREALAANQLAECYAKCCAQLLDRGGCAASGVVAVGVHGQTIRHRPDLGYTRQTNNPALLAERVGIDVIADFRSRDIAAGGQGAPLVPAFHAAVFGAPDETRVICNIGGISNISILSGVNEVSGFDCGPGNVLLDAWVQRHLGTPYDEDGRFAARGRVDAALLARWMSEPYLLLAPPKSTGRDLFHLAWLEARLAGSNIDTEDVQATLTAFTASTIANDIAKYAPACRHIFVCGGGSRNPTLMTMLGAALAKAGINGARLEPTQALGIDAQHVEALAFAWLAHRFTERNTANLPSVTGAKGPRVLGALYPR